EIYKEYKIRENELKKRIQTLWDEKVGLFLDEYIDGEKIYVKTPGGMIPLLGIPDTKKINKIVKHLFNQKEFWTDFPVPTLSVDDPYFNAEDEYQSYWNGRVWPNINWLLIEMLVRNKKFMEAKILIEKTINLCIASGQPQCYENYNPFTGLPYITHNIFNYGWGGIFNDILIRRVLGIQFDARKGKIYLCPFLFDNIDYFELKNIKFGESYADIFYENKRFKIKSEKKLKVVLGNKLKEGKEVNIKIEKSEKVIHFLDL
ncbi:MAG: MGH1-like glycoside hydrolase domain-containing protein, partial [Candidatus Ratteibacteria bacterium]